MSSGGGEREIEAVARAIAEPKLRKAADNAERNAILGDAYNDAKSAIAALDRVRGVRDDNEGERLHVDDLDPSKFPDDERRLVAKAMARSSAIAHTFRSPQGEDHEAGIDEFLAAWFALGEAAPRRESVRVAIGRYLSRCPSPEVK